MTDENEEHRMRTERAAIALQDCLESVWDFYELWPCNPKTFDLMCAHLQRLMKRRGFDVKVSYDYVHRIGETPVLHFTATDMAPIKQITFKHTLES